MIIGVPKEIKDNEYRVAMTPGGVHQVVEYGHQVWVETTAGEGSGFSDAQYEAAVPALCRQAVTPGLPRWWSRSRSLNPASMNSCARIWCSLPIFTWRPTSA